MADPLEEAIIAASQVQGAVLVGYVLVAVYSSGGPEEATGYWHSYSKGQPYHSTLGLLYAGVEFLQDAFAGAVDEEEDE